MPAHMIRLREPWDRGSIADKTVRLSRKFNSPTGIEGGARVYLAIANPTLWAEVWLNERQLAHAGDSADRLCWDITPLLQWRNEVILVASEKAGDASASGLEPLVRLEIEEGGGESSEFAAE